MKKRILFLMSDTGGGHRAAAQAIEEALHYLYPTHFETFIDDIWRTQTPWPVNKIPNSYPWLIGPGQPLWRMMWSGSAKFQSHKLIFPSLSPVLERKIMRYLSAIRPDLVVSVHPFMNHLGLKWRDKLKRNIPFVTVVTDMVTVHPLWICPDVTLCLVPTEAAKQSAIKFGMFPEKIEVCGQPIGLKFARLSALDKRHLHQKLGFNPKRWVVMIMGGGEGSGRIYEIARAVAQIASQVQLLIVAGRNKSLKEKLEKIKWKVPTRIYGFTNNIPELMQAADILITKAGPGTISEAFVAGLPIIISGYIPGQEEGTITYIQQHQAGAYADNPQEIARLVQSWITPGNTALQQLVCNARRLARPNASLTIASKICGLLEDSFNFTPPRQTTQKDLHRQYSRNSGFSDSTDLLA